MNSERLFTQMTYAICIAFSAFMLYNLGRWSVKADIDDMRSEVRKAHTLVAESSRICQLVQLHNQGRR